MEVPLPPHVCPHWRLLLYYDHFVVVVHPMGLIYISQAADGVQEGGDAF